MFKKALAMLLCILVVLSVATVTFAADPVRIKVEAEAATEKTLTTTPVYQYNDPNSGYILWDGTNTYENRPIDATTGYHYYNADPAKIHMVPKDTYTYTFDVSTAGTYTFGVNAENTSRNTTLTVFVDGSATKADGVAQFAAGEGFADRNLFSLHLDKGQHTFKVTFDVDPYKNYNIGIDYIYLDLVEADPTEPDPTEPDPTDPDPTEPDPTEPAAPATEILKGTATIDGVLDAAYKNSYSISVDKSSVIWVPKADPDNVSATVYFMHDGEYLYICGVVTGDSTVVNTNPAKPEEWAVDGLDIWFLMPELPLRTKFTMDAYALPYGTALQTKEQEWSHNIDVTKIEKAAVRGDGTYVVEAKLPIPYYLKSEKSLAINVQLNNVYDADVNSGVANYNCGFYGKQYTEVGKELDANIVTLSDTPAGTTGNPNTGDFLSVIIGMLAVSGLGLALVIGKKKER